MGQYRYLRICAWAGPLLLLVTTPFWIILGHNYPPPSPALDAEAFAAVIRANAMEIRIGMIFQDVFWVLYFIWSVAIWKVMQKIERDNDILSTLHIFGAALTTMVLIIQTTLVLAVAYRPETMEPKTLQILYDLAWFFVDNAFAVTTMQLVAMTVCFLSDKRQKPLIPAWAAWIPAWVGISFVLEMVMPLVTSGPFSRSGLINFWIEFGVFILMIFILSIYLLRAIARLEREEPSRAADA